MQKKSWLRALTIIVCLYLIITTIQAIVDLWKVGDKELIRQKRISLLLKENQSLLAQKQLTQSQTYWEKIARDDLGMSKKGEEIIIIPDELLKDNTPIVSPDHRPNWRKWVDLIL